MIETVTVIATQIMRNILMLSGGLNLFFMSWRLVYESKKGTIFYHSGLDRARKSDD